VQPLKSIVTVLVLVVWAACTAHCAIESLCGGASPTCCNEDGGGPERGPAGPEQCVCSAIQAGGYVSQEVAHTIPAPLDCVLVFVVAPEPSDLAMPPGCVAPTSRAPGAFQPWQFSFRAALPARAPSLVS
jgi:hypothetical protein